MVSICLNVQFPFFVPSGAIPPWEIDKLGSGINFFKFTLCFTPSPLHDGHIPLGELKEKLFGSGLGYDIPELGHIKFLLKYLDVFFSTSRIIITSCP